MQGIFAAIFLIVALGGSPQMTHAGHEHPSHEVIQVEDHHLARATSFRAVCSKGDLNSVFSNRADAVRAAQNHQKATGHTTSVSKQ